MVAGPNRGEVSSCDGDAREIEDPPSAHANGAGVTSATRIGEGLTGLLSRAREQTERLRDAARDRVPTRSAALRHALAARKRGNLEAAFWLLTEEMACGSACAEVELAFWEIAVDLGRPARAAEAAVSLVKRNVASGDTELAVLCWTELVRALPDQLVPPATLAALLPLLRSRVAEAKGHDRREAVQLLRTALRHTMDSRNEAPGPGLALRIFEEAKDHHPDVARRAAELALESESLHEQKRHRLRSYLDTEATTREPDRPPESSGATSEDLPPESDDARSESDEAQMGSGRAEHTMDDPSAHGARLKVLEATPIRLGHSELEVQTQGKRTRLPFEDIQGVSTVRIDEPSSEDDDSTVVLVDLILNLDDRGDEPLRILRLRPDEIDLAALGGDLETFLSDLLSRASAVPLPDPESAMGLRLASFPSIAHYEQELRART